MWSIRHVSESIVHYPCNNFSCCVILSDWTHLCFCCQLDVSEPHVSTYRVSKGEIWQENGTAWVQLPCPVTCQPLAAGPGEVSGGLQPAGNHIHLWGQIFLVTQVADCWLVVWLSSHHGIPHSVSGLPYLTERLRVLPLYPISHHSSSALDASECQQIHVVATPLITGSEINICLSNSGTLVRVIKCCWYLCWSLLYCCF